MSWKGAVVKVYRHSQDDSCDYYDGWFLSKIYAVSENKMLVYDNGLNSAIVDEYVPHFEWVIFDETYYDKCEERYHTLVELYKEAE